jgi:hypothetical protein
MIPFPTEHIHDEDQALDWWEHKFAAGCDAMGVQVNAAALVRDLVSSLRTIRESSLDEPLSLTEAANRTGYSADHIGRLVREGTLPNAGRKHAPKVRARDLVVQLKPKLAGPSPKAYDPNTDARSLRVRR